MDRFGRECDPTQKKGGLKSLFPLPALLVIKSYKSFILRHSPYAALIMFLNLFFEIQSIFYKYISISIRCVVFSGG